MAAGNLRSLVILVVSSMLVFPTLGQAASKYKEVEGLIIIKNKKIGLWGELQLAPK